MHSNGPATASGRQSHQVKSGVGRTGNSYPKRRQARNSAIAMPVPWNRNNGSA